MGRNLLVIFLVAVILTLLLPLTTAYFANEPAFTADNLIKINSVSEY